MDPFLIVALFIFGLIFGSFLNVVTIRYNPDKGFSNVWSLGGRSHCPACRAQLAWYELVPVLSYLFLRGRCRHCGHRISVQYPIVELLTAIICVAVPYRIFMLFQPGHAGGVFVTPAVFDILAALWTAVFVLLLVLAVIDFRHMIIPDAVNVALALLGVVIAGITQWVQGFGLFQGSFLLHYAALFGLRDSIWTNHLIAAIVGLVFFGGIIAVSRGRAMGWGDFKLAGALGILFGWPDIALVIALSFVIGSIVSVGLMIRGRKHMKDAVPFGPFLVLGSATVFFFGHQLMFWYFGSFGLL